MTTIRAVQLKEVPAFLLNDLETRDAAVWLLESFVQDAPAEAVAAMLRLPWAFVLSDSSDANLLSCLETPEEVDDPLVRQRGFIQIVDINPGDVILPPRGLPIFLLNGRPGAAAKGLVAQTRRLTMLAELSRHSVKQVVVLAGASAEIPPELEELWNEGLGSSLVVVSHPNSDKFKGIELRLPPRCVVGHLEAPAEQFAREISARYHDGHALDRLVLRVRNAKGENERVDISGLDDPEHPILGKYELLAESDLRPLRAQDLRQEEVEGFFKQAGESWRPYAAGMPWTRIDDAWPRMRNALRKLDRDAQAPNEIFFARSESGAGATTFIRSLAWAAADAGYPTLVARSATFVPRGVEVISFMTRVGDIVAKENESGRLYQVPWLIVFDRAHWEGREADVAHFAKEIERSGRRVCILMVTGPYLSMSMLSLRNVNEIADLGHQISIDDTVSLGRHLNNYLQHYGSVRSESEWRTFFEASALQVDRGIASFWIALSFWLQRQFDMSETVQSWIYRKFKEGVSDPVLRSALVGISALSSERQLYPEAMLPESQDWPTTQKLGDIQRDVAPLGLLRVSSERDRYWALAHDVLGRYILTALFYDAQTRTSLGFGEAKNPEHLRFMALAEVAKMPALSQKTNRPLAEAFAVSIFKVDPDHGHATFAPYWRDLLKVLDQIPQGVKASSRSFLHHVAISRRRISKDHDLFQMSVQERVELLTQAVTDLDAALLIPRDLDGETDLSLYNSLAHACHDLMEAEIAAGAGSERVGALRERARKATLLAFSADPDNSFVIETYARGLLSECQSHPESAAENAIEVLSTVYAAMERDSSGHRGAALSRLADAAFALLMTSSLLEGLPADPTGESEAIVQALRALGEGIHDFEGMQLRDYPSPNRIAAAKLLSDERLTGNPQAVKLRYMLTCINEPTQFEMQLELLQSLQGSAGTIFTPQMRLELAILLHQRDRHHEANLLFKQLRSLWKTGGHYVEVPDRLRWLLALDARSRRQVSARVLSGMDQVNRAHVRELQDAHVLFRPQEFGQQRLTPGVTISGLISFGHNGPFLRPLTAA